MAVDSKFGLLRKVLHMLGLSQQASDDVVNFIVDLLTEGGNSGKGIARDASIAVVLDYHRESEGIFPTNQIHKS